MDSTFQYQPAPVPSQESKQQTTLGSLFRRALIPAVLITLFAEPFFWIVLDNTFDALLSGQYMCNYFDSATQCSLSELVINSLLMTVMFNLFTLGLYTIIPAGGVLGMLMVLMAIGNKITNSSGSRIAGLVFVIFGAFLSFCIVMGYLSAQVAKQQEQKAAYEKAQVDKPLATVDVGSPDSRIHRIYGTAPQEDAVVVLFVHHGDVKSEVLWKSGDIPVEDGKWYVDVTIPPSPRLEGDYEKLDVLVYSSEQDNYEAAPLVADFLIYTGPQTEN